MEFVKRYFMSVRISIVGCMYKKIDMKLQKGEGHDLDLKEYIEYQIADRFNTLGNETNCFYVGNFGLHTLMRISFTEIKAAFQLFLRTIKELKKKIGEKDFPTVIYLENDISSSF